MYNFTNNLKFFPPRRKSYTERKVLTDLYSIKKKEKTLWNNQFFNFEWKSNIVTSRNRFFPYFFVPMLLKTLTAKKVKRVDNWRKNLCKISCKYLIQLFINHFSVMNLMFGWLCHWELSQMPKYEKLGHLQNRYLWFF